MGEFGKPENVSTELRWCAIFTQLGDFHRHRRAKARRMGDECVELAILTASIHTGRKIRHELTIVGPAAERYRQQTRVDAHANGLHASAKDFLYHTISRPQ